MYSQDAPTNVDAKYVKRRGSAQGCAFSGSQNQNLHPLFSKPDNFRPHFVLLKYSAEKQL